MSFVKVWVHIVFSTKNREPLLTREIRYQIKNQIIKNCKDNTIYLKAINGYVDHLHCLISLGKEQSIAKVVQLIKGSSANWANNNPFIKGVFMWQDDYFAVSVSDSQLHKVVLYIKNQERHHFKQSFNQETEEFKRKFGWIKIRD